MGYSTACVKKFCLLGKWPQSEQCHAPLIGCMNDSWYSTPRHTVCSIRWWRLSCKTGDHARENIRAFYSSYNARSGTVASPRVSGAPGVRPLLLAVQSPIARQGKPGITPVLGERAYVYFSPSWPLQGVGHSWYFHSLFPAQYINANHSINTNRYLSSDVARYIRTS